MSVYRRVDSLFRELTNGQKKNIRAPLVLFFYYFMNTVYGFGRDRMSERRFSSDI